MISFQDLRKIRPWLTATFVTFLGYVAVGWPSVLWLHHVATRQDASASTALAVPWLATGVAVACLMHFGIRAWPAVFAGSMAVWGVIEHGTLPLTLGESVSEALSAVLIVWLLRAWEFHPALDRYKDSLLLIAAVCVGRMASAAFDALSVIATAAYASDPGVIAYLRSVGAVRTGHVLMINIDLLRFTGRWWLNTVAGCLLVVPLLALRTRRLAPRREHPRLALATLSSVAALWLTAALVLPPGPLLPMLLLGALLLAVWAAVQFGVGVAAAITLLLALSSRI